MKNLVILLTFTMIFVSCKSESGGNGGTTYSAMTRYFAYATNFGDDSIEVMDIKSSTSNLTQVEVKTTCDGPMMSKVHPDLNYLYVTCSNSDSIAVYSIAPKTGELTLVEEEFNVGDYPHGVDITPNGEFLFASMESDAKLVSFSINRSNGHLDRMYEVATGGAPHDVKVVDKNIYVANFSATLGNTVSVFNYNEFVGEPESEQTAAAGTNPHRMFVSGDDQIYVANRGSNEITLFNRNTSTGRLSSAQTIATGSNPTSFTIVGDHAYASNWSDDTLSVYSVANDGTLTSIGTEIVGDGPSFVLGVPFKNFVITLHENTSDSGVYDKGSTGILSDSGLGFTVGSAPQHITYKGIRF